MVAKRSTKSSTSASAKQKAPAAAAAAAEAATTPVAAQHDSGSDSENGDASEQSGSDNEKDNDSGTDDEPQSDGDNDDDDDGLDLDIAAQDGDDDDDEALDAVGFGDAMSKILGQTVASDAQPILAKRTTARMREIMAEKKVVKTARISAAEKREKEQKDMIMPSHATAAQDRRLRSIATKGVVALFNAIEKHQHQHGKPSDAKNDKKVKEMSKDNFLGLLKAQQKSVTEAAPATTAATKSSWSVVQDDYMMGAKLKDWDATHGTEKGRARNDDDVETEAAEDAAWRQVGDLDSDDDAAAGSAATKRKSSSGKTSDRKPAPKKKTKRT